LKKVKVTCLHIERRKKYNRLVQSYTEETSVFNFVTEFSLVGCHFANNVANLDNWFNVLCCISADQREKNGFFIIMWIADRNN
jgi:hypothetical protein